MLLSQHKSGSDGREIGRVKGHGSSIEPHGYSLKDERPLPPAWGCVKSPSGENRRFSPE
jgi:hypothetical protein